MSAGLPVGHLTVPCAQVPVRAGRVTIVDERLVATAHDLGVQIHV